MGPTAAKMNNRGDGMVIECYGVFDSMIRECVNIEGLFSSTTLKVLVGVGKKYRAS